VKKVLGVVTACALVAAGAAGGVSLRRASAPETAQGIGVHGAWTITVKSRAGAVVGRRSFHNDLTDQGRKLLAEILTGDAVAGGWFVTLSAGNGALACDSQTDSCTVAEATPGELGHLRARLIDFPQTPTDGQPQQKAIELSGVTRAVSSAPAAPAGIRFVSTGLRSCDRQRTAAQCETQGVGSSRFTSRQIAPIPVARDQLIQVRVILTFGTLATTPS
jgi:hypothetical protein